MLIRSLIIDNLCRTHLLAFLAIEWGGWLHFRVVGVLKMNVSSFFSYFLVILSLFGKLKKLYRLLQVPQPPPNEPNGLLSYFSENPPVDEEVDIDAALNDQSLDDMMDQEPQSHSYPDQYDGKVKVNSHVMPIIQTHPHL